MAEPGTPKIAIRLTRIACLVPKATNTHTHNIQYLLHFHDNNIYMNTPQCHVICTLPVLCLNNTQRGWIIYC